MTLIDLRRRIWTLAKQSVVNIQVAADKAGVQTPIRSVQDAEAVIAVLTKPRRKAPPVPQFVKDRYLAAHRLFFARQYPAASGDGHYATPEIPPVHTSNGLQRYIVNFCTWMGCYGNRINTTGRRVFDKKKGREVWIKGSTATGSGDTVTCIKSDMVWFEVKIGKDGPSDKQLREQSRVIAAGGYYYFTKTAEDFLSHFDAHYYGS